jgi:hypothetical protein
MKISTLLLATLATASSTPSFAEENGLVAQNLEQPLANLRGLKHSDKGVEAPAPVEEVAEAEAPAEEAGES